MRILPPAYVTQRIKDGVSDRFYDFHPFDYRPGDRQRIDGVGDDAMSPATIALTIACFRCCLCWSMVGTVVGSSGPKAFTVRGAK